MTERSRGFGRAADPESDRHVTTSVVGLVKARDLRLERCGTVLAAAGGNISIVNGGCGAVASTGDVSIRYGGCGPLVTTGNVSIENGGTQAVVAKGRVTIGRKAFVGFVVSPNVTVEAGGRVLMSGPLAVAASATAALGVTLLARLVRR
jgi:hypothetical protein